MIIDDKADELINLRKDIDEKKKELDRIKDKETVLSEEIIPEILDAQEQTASTTKQHKISVYSTYRPNLPQGSQARETALEWLADNGYEDIFKHRVIIRFDPEDADDMKRFVELAQSEQGVRLDSEDDIMITNATIDREIHWQTFQALINEQVQIDPDFPLDLFNCYEQKRTKVEKL